ncbi:MAG: phosphatase PAP2 family protein [Chlorobi bacterium]|nr:phosphatase PAP2 family protein [Chlorobiota bacterium]
MEREWVRWVYLHRPAEADHWLIALTDGVTAVTVVVLLLLAAGVWIRRTYAPGVFWQALLALAITGIWVHLLKWIVRRGRPFTEMGDLEVLVRSGGYSFPSGHTAEVFTLVFVLWPYVKHPFLRALLAGWALLIAYTRVAFGVHYPTDLAGGILVAAFSAAGAKFLLKKFAAKKFEDQS